MGGFLGHFPQAIVGVEVAIGMPKFAQPRGEHGEMACFVIRATGPIAIVGIGLAAEAVHRVPGQIDRVELDMRHRMHQRRAAFRRTQAAMRDLPRRHQGRPERATWCGNGFRRRRVFARAKLTGEEGLPGVVGKAQLVGRLAGVEATLGGLMKIGHTVKCSAGRIADLHCHNQGSRA